MVRTGESSGNLKEILQNLAAFMEQEQEFKDSVFSALIYPAFVTAVGAVTVIVLLVFVVPGLVSMFSDMGQQLPLPTRALIGLSSFFVRYWLIGAGAAAAAVFRFRFTLSSEKGRLLFDQPFSSFQSIVRILSYHIMRPR
jgi:general secretion pathway protein F